MYLNLIFNSEREYLKAKTHFETNSDFYAEENDRNRMLAFEVSDQSDADSTEHYIEQELQGETDIQGYHFEIEYGDDEDDYYNQNESKKAKVKTLIERIVERVIAKKLNESKRSKRRLKESVELEDDLGNLDQYIIMNFDEIQKNMKTYGFEPIDLKDVTNYYDIAHILGVDTRLIKDADLDYITRMMHGIINDINDEEY